MKILGQWGQIGCSNSEKKCGDPYLHTLAMITRKLSAGGSSTNLVAEFLTDVAQLGLLGLLKILLEHVQEGVVLGLSGTRISDAKNSVLVEGVSSLLGFDQHSILEGFSLIAAKEWFQVNDREIQSVAFNVGGHFHNDKENRRKTARAS